MSERALAIGNFDGVHRGHQAIIAAARATAGSGGTVVAVTFWPHPIAVLRPDQAPDLVTDLADRIDLLHQVGADDVTIVDFSNVMAWSAARFVDRVIRPLQPTAVVVGENFRFGAGASADGEQLRGLAGDDFQVVVLPLLADDGPVSTSRIRQGLVDGDVGLVTRLLGRHFQYSGLVVLGDQRGRELGFPTANLVVPAGLACFADGVYAGYLIHGDQRWPAAISVGTNPTFDGSQRRVEAHAIGRTDLALYGERVGVEFVERLRGQIRFDSRQGLIDQMTADVAATAECLAG